ncbi:hypothetical protein HHK36_002672 [Tetracentron sinense]|uniref:Uncharacterized protein n=1 Tax=Tetracentron sinense TaxID=13715 RepID=A0A834ZML2_TETSI|nr:hypothetical protein HHK36_002672 [Tetracentron sinense]
MPWRMTSQNLRSSVSSSSSSSSSAKRPVALENAVKVTAILPHQAKKRPSLTNLTTRPMLLGTLFEPLEFWGIRQEIYQEVRKLQRACLRNPVKIEAASKYSTVATLKQQYRFVPAKYEVVSFHLEDVCKK